MTKLQNIFFVCYISLLIVCNGQDIAFPERELNPLVLNKDNRQPLYAPSRCKENEYLYPGDQINDWVCDCVPGFVFYPLLNKCFAAFRQGPCTASNYLILKDDEVIPTCETNPCTLDGFVVYNNFCYRLGSTDPCGGVGNGTVGVRVPSLEIDCVNYDDIVSGIPKPRNEIQPNADGSTNQWGQGLPVNNQGNANRPTNNQPSSQNQWTTAPSQENVYIPTTNRPSSQNQWTLAPPVNSQGNINYPTTYRPSNQNQGSINRPTTYQPIHFEENTHRPPATSTTPNYNYYDNFTPLTENVNEQNNLLGENNFSINNEPHFLGQSTTERSTQVIQPIPGVQKVPTAHVNDRNVINGGIGTYLQNGHTQQNNYQGVSGAQDQHNVQNQNKPGGLGSYLQQEQNKKKEGYSYSQNIKGKQITHVIQYTSSKGSSGFRIQAKISSGYIKNQIKERGR